VDVFDVSLYMTIVYLTEVVLSAPVGRLLQRFDMRIVCTAAACSTSLGFAAMSFYTELWQWYLSGVLIGFGEITLLWLMVASLLNRWFSKRLGLVIGLSYAMTGVGGAVLNLVGQFLLGADLSGWREVYLVLGLVAFALSVPFTLFAIRSHPEDVGLKAYGAVLEPSVAQSFPPSRRFGSGTSSRSSSPGAWRTSAASSRSTSRRTTKASSPSTARRCKPSAPSWSCRGRWRLSRWRAWPAARC